MPIISRFKDQARTYYDESKVKERKAVSYESPAKGYSTVYQWSFIVSLKGGLVEPHVHKGFEILTYVIQGEVEQEREEGGEWVKLSKGDISVLKSGNGLTHSERYAPETKVLQVWLDPDFRRSLQRPSVFNVYEAEDFEIEDFNGMKRVDFCSDDAPLWTATKVQLDRFDFEAGQFSLEIASGTILSFVVISGTVTVDEEKLGVGDYFQVNGSGNIQFSSDGPGSVFAVNTPQEAGYRTYTDQLQLSS